MKIYYDPEHDACAVEFDKDDALITSIHRGKIFIESCKGGKPRIIKKQLMFSIEEVKAQEKKVCLKK